MKTSIDIFGVPLDIINKTDLTDYVDEYLTNDSLNIILTANSTMLDTASYDKEYSSIIGNADLILPGSDTLLSMHMPDFIKSDGTIVDYQYLEEIFQHISGKKWTMYIIGRKKKECDLLIDHLNQEYPNLLIVGSYYDELEQKEELIVNEINSFTPDILLFATDSPIQERWIITNSAKLNVKLCIGIGNMIGALLEEIKEVPKIVKAMNLEEMYRKMKKNKSMKQSGETRILKKSRIK